MSDKRVSKRRRVLKAGKINFDAATVDCVIRDISAAGAGLQIQEQERTRIPHEFNLWIGAERTGHACHVVWRKQMRMGVAFY